MALHAETVEILIGKAHFEPAVALGVAEAIESAMTRAQFVTVPILDARLHEVHAEIRVLEGKMEASIKELKVEFKAAMDTRFAELDTKFAKMETKLAEVEAKLVRWVFLVMLGNVALSLAANTLISVLKNG